MGVVPFLDGEGWFRLLLSRLLLLRRNMQQKIRSASSRRAPRTDPTTIPAICPPDRPPLLCVGLDVAELDAALPLVEAVVFAVVVAVAVVFAVDVTVSVGIAVNTGNLTFWHRLSAFDSRQQESVLFSLLERQ